MYDRKYDKVFIILRQEGESGGTRVPAGNCTIELRNGNAKGSLYAQGLRQLSGGADYEVYLVAAGGQDALAIPAGKLIVDERGQGMLSWTFSVDDVGGCGRPLEDFNTVVVLLEDKRESGLVCPLCGYTWDRKEWKPYFRRFSAKTSPQIEKFPTEIEKKEAAAKKVPLKTVKAKEPVQAAKPQEPARQEMGLPQQFMDSATMSAAETVGQAAKAPVIGIEDGFREMVSRFRQEMSDLEEAGILTHKEAVPFREPVAAKKMKAPAEVTMDIPDRQPQPMGRFKKWEEVERSSRIEKEEPGRVDKIAGTMKDIGWQVEEAIFPPAQEVMRRVERATQVVAKRMESATQVLPEKAEPVEKIELPVQEETVQAEPMPCPVQEEMKLVDGIEHPLSEEMDSAKKTAQIVEEGANPVEKIVRPLVEAVQAETVEKEKSTAAEPAKTQQLLFGYNPRLTPFLEVNAWEWVRISPRDLGLLPLPSLAYYNHPFILAGWRRYRHLLLGRDGKDGLVLGVPDTYSREYAEKAGGLGFREFRCCEGGRAYPGKYGYWLMYLQPKKDVLK